MPAPVVLSLAQARRTAVAASGLARRRPAGPVERRHLRRVLDTTLLLQLDSVSVFARAHYVPPLSRLGPYPPALLDALAAPGPRRELFEYWGREASLLPVRTHPLLRWRMERAARLETGWGSTRRVAAERPQLVAALVQRLREQGPATAGELREAGDRRAAGWWAWDGVKAGLEHLFWTGRVTTHSRRGFERVYDLTERVLPAAVLDLPTPEPADAVRALVRAAAASQGVCTPTSLADAWKLEAADAARAVTELREAGELLPLRLRDGRQDVPGTWLLSRDAPLPRRVRGRALLSPFDPLVRERRRTEALFGFRYRLEIYVPAARRVHGYYVLPYLHDGALAARVDLKADRAVGALRVLAAWGDPDPEVVDGLAGALQEAARWRDLERVVVNPLGDLAAALTAALATRSPG